MKRLSSLLGRFLSRRDPDGSRRELSRLWRRWAEVVGPVDDRARPLGHRGTTLVIGAEDHMVAQELVMQAPMILAMANDFLGRNFFDKVHVDLLGDHVSLDAPRPLVAGSVTFTPRGPHGGDDPAQEPGPPPKARLHGARVRSSAGDETPGSGATAPHTTTFPKEDS